MKLKFITPEKAAPVYRASVHRTGKIGFTIETAEHFKINVDKSLALAINEDDVNDKCLYGVLNDGLPENAYKIMKAAKYHSVSAKSFFETVGIDFSKGDVSYTINEIEIDGAKMLKFTPRNIEKRAEKIEEKLNING